MRFEGSIEMLAFVVVLCALLQLGSARSFELVDANHRADRPKSVGIWYETWYCVYGNYIVGQNLGVGAEKFVADVNEDGLSDAILWYKNAGVWKVSHNSGKSFGYETSVDGSGFCGASALWASVAHISHAAGAHLLCLQKTNALFALPLDNSTARWTQWAPAVSAPLPALPIVTADVNGDGLADLVIPQAGSIAVALSDGSTFGSAIQFLQADLSPFTGLAAGDVNGDGFVDIAFYNPATLCLSVALSRSSSFAALQSWGCSPHFSSNIFFLAPTVSGAKTADAIFFVGGGVWYHAISSGSSFAVPSVWVSDHGRACDHGKCGQGEESQERRVGNVFASDSAAPIAIWADGRWAALPPSYGAPNLYNTWEGWFLGYVPLIGKYDSGNATVINAHFESFTAATVDYFIYDFTNGIDTGFIRDRGWIVSQQLVNYRQAHNSSLAYAIAIGGVQYSGDPKTMEVEAGIAWDKWVTNASCGGPDTYFHVDGKPLLLSYTSYAQRKAWEQLSDHTNTDKFTVRWVQGALPDQGRGCPAQSGGIDPHKPWFPPPGDYGLYYGWGIPNGSLPNPDTMVVMPGWNNSEGCVVPRNAPSPMSFYDTMCWDHVFAAAPTDLVINSWNEFAEQTAMEPADSAHAPPGCDKWINASGALDAHVYWTTTVDNIRKWRALPRAKHHDHVY